MLRVEVCLPDKSRTCLLLRTRIFNAQCTALKVYPKASSKPHSLIKVLTSQGQFLQLSSKRITSWVKQTASRTCPPSSLRMQKGCRFWSLSSVCVRMNPRKGNKGASGHALMWHRQPEEPKSAALNPGGSSLGQSEPGTMKKSTTNLGNSQCKNS